MTTIEHAHQVTLGDRGLLREIKQAIRRLLPDAEIWLFGSAARGTRQPDSDYDILVLTEEPLTGKEQDVVRASVLNIELERAAVICIGFCAVDEWDGPPLAGSPFREHVEHDAIIL